MAFFGETLANLAAGRRVNLLALAEFQFIEGTSYFWINGPGTVTVDGHDWLGVGKLVSISAISTGETGDNADKMTFTLSGVDAAILAIAQQAERIRGRSVIIYGQFRDPDTKELLDDKWVIPTADVMDAIGYTASGIDRRVITMSAETIWSVRNIASNGFFSDRDQKERFPEDRFFEFIYKMKNKKTTWPKYTEG